MMRGVKGRRFIVLFKYNSIRSFLQMPVWSLTCQQSVFQRYDRGKHFSQFYPQDGGEMPAGIEVMSLSPYVLVLLLWTLQKSDLLSHKRKLLYEGRIKWMSAHGKAFGLCSLSGPDLREGKLGNCPGPPQLGGLHKNILKIITQGNIKKYFLKLIIWNKKYDVSLFI